MLSHDAERNALMAYEFKLPDLGEGLTEGEVARWLVAEGQEIAEDDLLVEIQTDKATVEIPPRLRASSRASSRSEGEVVPVGTVLVSIGGDGAAPPTGAGEPAAAAPRTCSCNAARAQGRPGARCRPRQPGGDRSARAHHRGGRARGRLGWCSRRRSQRAAARRPPGDRRAWRGAPGSAAGYLGGGVRLRVGGPGPARGGCCQGVRDERPGLPGAQRLARARRDRLPRALRHRRGGADAAGAHRAGRAGCDAKSVDEIHDELAALAERGRAGELAPEELRGSTFTVTSAGKLGGLLSTPIVNHPEVAILSIGRIGDRPVAVMTARSSSGARGRSA